MMTHGLEETAAYIGSRVRRKRQRLGLSQRALAEAIRIERATLTRLELGEVRDGGLALGMLLRIAAGLGCHIRDLLPPRRRVSSH